MEEIILLVIVVLILIILIWYLRYKGTSNKNSSQIGQKEDTSLNSTKKSEIVETSNSHDYISDRDNPKLSVEGFSLDRQIDIFNDSYYICQNSKSIDIYFERRQVMFEMLSQLLPEFKDLNEYRNLDTDKIIELLNKLNSNIFLTSEFIDRYFTFLVDKVNSLKTNRAKVRNINNFQNSLEDYSDQISANDMLRFQNGCKQLLEKYSVSIDNPINETTYKKNNWEDSFDAGYPLYMESKSRYAKKDFQGSLDVAFQALAVGYTNWNVYTRIAMGYRKLKEYDAEIAIMEKAKKELIDDPSFISIKADADYRIERATTLKNK